MFQIINQNRKKRTAVITGASGDIGKAIAWRLAHEGWNLALQAFKHLNEAENLALNLSALEIKVKTYQVDLVDAKACETFARQVLADFGEVTCLVNNAGVSSQKLLTELSEYEWQQVQNVNLNPVYRLSRAFIPSMLSKQEGCIINISSVWGQVGASCEVAYSTSKAGLIGFTKALGKELGPAGIRVNCICPGVIEGKMNAGLNADELDELRQATPLARIGKPEDVASAVAFLASDEAAFITCQDFAVDGGFAS